MSRKVTLDELSIIASNCRESIWAERNHMALIYAAGAYVLFFFALWSLSLLTGFWSNALFATHFELNVGMTGVGTIATAGGTVYGIARAAQAKYKTDSELNSESSRNPYDKGGTK